VNEAIESLLPLVLCKLKFYPFGCVKASGLGDRKLTCIDLILANLRSPNRESFHVSPKGKILVYRALEQLKKTQTHACRP
jgi:hypothetical protein